jgi:hypothetical protein
MKLYYLISFIMLFQFQDGYSQNKIGEGQIEAIFEGLNTKTLMSILT